VRTGSSFLANRELPITFQGALRLLLASYLKFPLTKYALTSGPKGKPSLSMNHVKLQQISSPRAWRSNAFTNDCAVGRRCRRLRQLPDIRQICFPILLPGEAEELVPLKDTATAFFRCWTRKESIHQAVATVLSIPLD